LLNISKTKFLALSNSEKTQIRVGIRKRETKKNTLKAKDETNVG